MFYLPEFKHIELGAFSIETFRVFGYLAAFIGAWLFLREAKKRKFDDKESWMALASAAIFLVLGARLFYYFGPWSWDRGWVFSERIIKYFSFFGSGLVFYGGLIGAICGIYLYCKVRKADFWRHADVFALAAPIIVAVGRMGCFFSNDSCRGVFTDVPWGIIRYSGERIVTEATHPARLYSIFAMLVLFFVLKKLDKKKHFDGYIALVFLMSYSVVRFLVEAIKKYSWHFLGLTASQIISIAVFGFALVVFLKKRKLNRK